MMQIVLLSIKLPYVYLVHRICPRLNCKKSLEENVEPEQNADPSRTCIQCGAKLHSKYALKRHVSVIMSLVVTGMQP